MRYRIGLWLGLLVFLAFPALAAVGDVTTVDLSGSSFVRCNLTPGFIEGRLNVVARNASNDVENSAGLPMTFSLTGNSLANSVTESFNLTLSSTDVLPYGIKLGSAELTTVTITVTVGSASASVTYDCPPTPRPAPPAQPTDGRLNLDSGDLINVVYQGADGNGQPILTVWAVDTDSRGVYVGAFENALFAPYLEAAPAKNTLLGRIGQTSLYALTTGEFQVVVGPDAEGKTYTTVLVGLPVRRVYRILP
jgi:hypothetical protein